MPSRRPCGRSETRFGVEDFSLESSSGASLVGSRRRLHRLPLDVVLPFQFVYLYLVFDWRKWTAVPFVFRSDVLLVLLLFVLPVTRTLVDLLWPVASAALPIATAVVHCSGKPTPFSVLLVHSPHTLVPTLGPEGDSAGNIILVEFWINSVASGGVAQAAKVLRRPRSSDPTPASQDPSPLNRWQRQ